MAVSVASSDIPAVRLDGDHYRTPEFDWEERIGLIMAVSVTSSDIPAVQL
jgi:hypothetical protein